MLILADRKKEGIREVERWLARGKKPVTFAIGPTTTTWLNGKAATLADYKVGDRVGVFYRSKLRAPDLDKPVEAEHVRVGRVARNR